MNKANHVITTIIAAIILILCPHFVFAQTAGLMPMAVQQFFDNNGNPLSAGTVTTYIAGTSTLKTTWRDAAETIANTNPIVLDAGGKAIIFGDGNYRQLVKDRLGNTIWDAVTSAFGTGSASQIGDGTSVGTVLPWSGLVAPVRYAFAYGQELSRSTYSSLYNVITLSANVSCTSSSNILSGFSDTTQISIGAKIEVSCVAAGTTVTAKSASTVTVSNNASTTIATTAIIFPWGNGNGTTTFNVPDLRGRVLPGRDNMGGTAAARLTTAIYGAANPDSLGGAGGSQTQTMLTANLPAYTPTGTVTDSGHVHSIGNNIVIGATAIAGGQATPVATGGTALNTASGTANSTFAGVAQGGASTPFAIVQPSITLNYVVKLLPDVNISTLNVVTSLGGMVGDITCGAGVTCATQEISVQAGVGLGDVLGPASSTDGDFAVFDGLTGKIIRTSSGTLTNGVSIMAYGAKCDGTTDDSAAVQSALIANKIVFVPVKAPSYCMINATVTIPTGATIYAEATGINFNAGANCFKTTTLSGNMFVISGGYVSLLGVCFEHNGATGSIITDAGGSRLGVNTFQNIGLTATHATNPSPLVYFDSSANRISGCGATQHRTNINAYAFQFDATGGTIRIANTMQGCFFGGVNPLAGNVLYFGSTDGSARQEGFILKGNQFIGQGPSNLVLNAVLGAQIEGNVFDQGYGNNIVFAAGTLGVTNAVFINNYISTPSQTTTGVCVDQSVTGNAVNSVTFIGNEFIFCGFGVVFGANASNLVIQGNKFVAVGSSAININQAGSAIIDGNITASVGANFNYTISDGAAGGPYTVTNNQFDPTGNVVLTVTTPSKFRWANNTGGGGGFPAALVTVVGAGSGLSPTDTVTHAVLIITPVAVASLPTCNGAAEGARASVNNSNAASFTAGIGAVVAAGGTTHVPVFCDGTNWRIG